MNVLYHSPQQEKELLVWHELVLGREVGEKGRRGRRE